MSTSKENSSPSKRRRSRRRHSLPDHRELSRSRLSKSEELSKTNLSTSRAGRTRVLSLDNLRPSKEIHQEILQYLRGNRKQLTTGTDESTQTLNSDESTSEREKINVLKETHIAEVYQPENTQETASVGLEQKTVPLESVLALPRYPLDYRELTYLRSHPTLRLIAASKPVRQRFATIPYNARTIPILKQCLKPLHRDYQPRVEESPPPSPAPADPQQESRVILEGNSRYSIESGATERPWTHGRFPRDLCAADFLLLRRNSEARLVQPFFGSALSEFRPERRESTLPASLPTSPQRVQLTLNESALQYSYYSEPTSYRIELPKVSQTDSPRRQQFQDVDRTDVEYPTGLSYIDEPPFQSYLDIREKDLQIPIEEDYGVIRTPELLHQDIFCAERRREVLRYRKHSATTYLQLSPDSDDTVHQLPPECFRQTVQERFLERCPSPRLIKPLERLSQSQTSSPRRKREQSPPPSAYRYRASSPRRYELDPMGRMNSVEDHERKIIIEFCHLLEKSKQLFNGLRELPQYGHKQWHSYFGRTFDVYTKLWKFQQQHRVILDNKYGLKRWQIGEIASKIGQLYYHFYLRTSETAYLNEAYSFYYAIRGRSYYTQACKEDKCELMVKKLRYYARFIVACLLLKKVKLVKELIKELDKQIVEYGNAYQPEDQNEWRIVADQVRAFINVEPVVAVIHPDEYVVMLSHRLNPQSTPPIERSSVMNLSLQEALIIGSNSAQVKFSEITMDMFRMVQTLEREPTGDIQHMYDESPRQRYISTPSAVNNKGYSLEPGLSNRGESPHKYLLFKPSPNQIFVYLASAVDDLPPNGVVLVYISAEGLIIPPVKHPEDAGGYDVGGLITTSKTDLVPKEISQDGKPILPKYKDTKVLYPGDLYPFTRRPMFLIVDSDNSFIFHDVPRHFGQPLIILMSPLEQPASLHPTSGDKRAEGSLFTLFLHCPLSAFCFCCDIKMKSLLHWERAQAMIDSYLAEASQILIRSRVDSVFVVFMGDDFLRLLILRFIFCETFLRMHRLFRGRTQRTRVSPPLPDDLYEHSNLTQIVIELASHLQVRGHFHDPSTGVMAQPSNRE